MSARRPWSEVIVDTTAGDMLALATKRGELDKVVALQRSLELAKARVKSLTADRAAELKRLNHNSQGLNYRQLGDVIGVETSQVRKVVQG